MQKINRSKGTPLGMAFVFLCLTAIPVSLKAVGINVNFSPSLGAVTDAWQQIAGVFTNDYQSGNSSELIAVNKPASCDAGEAADTRLIARLELPETDHMLELRASDSTAPNLTVERNQAASSDAVSRHSGTAKRVKVTVATKAREPRMEFVFQNVQIARDLKSLVDEKEIQEHVTRQLKLNQREMEKAFKVLKLNDRTRFFISLPQGVGSKCGEKRALPIRPKVDFTWEARPARAPAPSAPAVENSEI